jgi:DNA-binding response OmpR family regulator
VADSERALAAGFDDFVAGRLSVRELAGRLRALLRRLAPRPAVAGRLGVGKLTLDAAGHDLWVGERRIRLTRLESLTLAALMRAPGHTLSRAELLDRVWGDGAADTSPRAVDNVMQRLRRKVGGGDAIVTVRGLGFRLAAGEPAGLG